MTHTHTVQRKSQWKYSRASKWASEERCDALFWTNANDERQKNWNDSSFWRWKWLAQWTLKTSKYSPSAPECVCVCRGINKNNLLQSGKLVLVILYFSQKVSRQQPTGVFVHLSHRIRRPNKRQTKRLNDIYPRLDLLDSTTGKTFRIRPESFGAQ